jgi:hypothetical protein
VSGDDIPDQLDLFCLSFCVGVVLVSFIRFFSVVVPGDGSLIQTCCRKTVFLWDVVPCSNSSGILGFRSTSSFR